MTGIFEVLPYLLFIAIVLLLYTPLVTVILLNQFKFFKSKNLRIKIAKIIIIYIALLSLLLFIASVSNGDPYSGLFVYSAILSLVAIANWAVNKTKANKEITESGEVKSS